jgi:putative ABC transport system permease protein
MKFLKSNLKLLATRFRAVTIINIAGLAVAFAVAAVIAIQVKYDLTFDRGYKNAGQIFCVELTYDQQPEIGVFSHMNQQIPRFMKDNVPEIKSYAQLRGKETRKFVRQAAPAGSPTTDIVVTEVSTGFLEVFAPTILSGDAKSAITTPKHAMISRQSARRIFGNEDPIGQTITSFESGDVTIGAVYEDFPKNSTVANGLLVNMAENDRSEWGFSTYMQFDPALRDDVVEKIHTINLNVDGDEVITARHEGATFHLTELSDHHLHGGAEGKGIIETSLYMLVMGVMIVGIALINFINLFMSMAPVRVRSINTFRILGSGKGALRRMLALESVVILLVAMAIGVGLMEWFGTSVFTQFFSADISPAANIPVIAALAAGLAVVSFVMALYPAHYATSFDVAVALKGSIVLAPRGVKLRSALITLQFATAIIFISLSIYIYEQYNYMQKYELGYQKENIVLIPTITDSLSRASFTQELRRNPDVVDVSWSARPGNQGMGWGREFEGKNIQVNVWPSEMNTLDFFGVEIVAGENFSPDITGVDQVIVNQKFLDTFGFTAEDVVGKDFSTFEAGVIVGVAADVNFESLHNEVRPMIFVTLDWWATQGLVKIAGGDTPATLRFIEDTYNKFRGDGREFSLEFLDAKLDAQYKTELNMSSLMGLLGLIAVVTAVMGVYVIILFNSRYKTREIAIRKVNGASVGEVTLMLNKGLLISLAVAAVLALAPTLYFMRGWVASFAYKVAVPWWLYPVAVVMVLMVAAVTVSWQSLRAATANPVNALKSE